MMSIHHFRLSFLGLCLLLLTANFSMTNMNVAVPSMMAFFNSSQNTIHWVISLYFFAAAAFLPLVGQLADKTGVKYWLILGTFLFSLTSWAGGLSTNLTMLLIMRCLQGISFTMIFSLSFTTIARIVPPQKQGFYLGLSITIVGIAQAAGPSMGGLLVQYYNWQSLLWAGVPLPLIAAYLLFLTLKVPHNNRITQPFHQSLKILVCHYRYLAVLILRFFIMGCWAIVLYIIPLWLIQTQGQTPQAAGFYLLSMMVIFAMLSPFAGKLLDQYGAVYPTRLSLLLAITSFLVLALAGHQLWILCFGLLLFGTATAFWVPGTLKWVFQETAQSMHGLAAGLFFTSAFIGASISVSLAAMLTHHYGISKGLSASMYLCAGFATISFITSLIKNRLN